MGMLCVRVVLLTAHKDLWTTTTQAKLLESLLWCIANFTFKNKTSQNSVLEKKFDFSSTAIVLLKQQVPSPR